jgi:hypothetical protein
MEGCISDSLAVNCVRGWGQEEEEDEVLIVSVLGNVRG